MEKVHCAWNAFRFSLQHLSKTCHSNNILPLTWDADENALRCSFFPPFIFRKKSGMCTQTLAKLIHIRHNENPFNDQFLHTDILKWIRCIFAIFFLENMLQREYSKLSYTVNKPSNSNLGIQPADAAGWRLKQCRTSSAAARHWLISFGKLIVEPKDISRASVRDLCLFIRGTGLLNLCWMEFWDCTISLRLTGPKEEEEEPSNNSSPAAFYWTRRFMMFMMANQIYGNT